MSGWRVWFAFEASSGVMNASTRDLSEHWRALAESCRGPGGTIDVAEFDRWLTYFVEYVHLWGHA